MPRPAHHLIDLIGEPAFVALAEAFGGTRLYVPASVTAEHEIAAAIGLSAARVLSRALAPDTVIVPLARELRARHYRDNGLSNARIARRMGLTEKGVEKLFARRRARGDDPPAPLPLFPDR